MLVSALVERECEGVYAAARLTLDDCPSIAQLIERIMGARPVLADGGPEAGTRRIGSVWSVTVRRDLSGPRMRWVAGVELARWWLPRYGAIMFSRETIRRLASAILVPRETFLDALEERGDMPAPLAEVFGTQQALTLLRLGETTGRPVALLDEPHHLITLRGHRSYRPRWIRIQLTDDLRVGMMAR